MKIFIKIPKNLGLLNFLEIIRIIVVKFIY